MSGQSGKMSAESVAVTCEPKSSSAKVATAAERREQREPLARAAPADACRVAGPDRDVDEQPDEASSRVARCAVTDSPELPRRTVSRPSHAWKPTSSDGRERRPQDRAAVAVVADGQDREAEDLEADEDRDAAVDPFDPGLGVVERRDDLAVAERPVGAAEAGIGGPDDDADRDQRERGHEGRQGKALEAGHEAAILSRADAATASGHRSAVPCRGDALPDRSAPDPGRARPARRRGRARRRRRPPSRERRRRRQSAARPAPRRALPDGARAGLDGGLAGRAADARPSSRCSSRTRSTCGPARILFSFLDADNRPVAAPDRTASVAFYDLGKDPTTPVTTVDGDVHLGDRGRARASTSSTSTCPRPARGAPSSRPQAPGAPGRDDPR